MKYAFLKWNSHNLAPVA